MFGAPLYGLLQLSLSTDLHSHIILIPIVSLYLAWIRKTNPAVPDPPNRVWSLAPGIGAAALLSFYWTTESFAAIEDSLAVPTLAYVLLIYSAALFTIGPRRLKPQKFALAFLVFLVPLPTIVQEWVNTFFQYTSAEVSYHMVRAAGIPIFRPDPLVFQLSTIEIYVAPSCSGIRSSLVLLITSIVAGELFLNSKWKRWFLVFFVVPLAVVRNGFRIFTISYLCVRVGPHMIDHWIHHKGGPFFFALSLVPFLALLFWMWKRESHERPKQDQPESSDIENPTTQSSRV